MAKPKKKPPAEKRPTVLSVKGTEEWREWVQEVAAHARTDTAKLLDHLLTEYAKKNGIKPPPPR